MHVHVKKEKWQVHRCNSKPTLLKCRLDLKASRTEAFVLSTTDFPLSLLCCEIRVWDAPTNFSCLRICEIIRPAFDVLAESRTNLSRYGMCSVSIVLMQDKAIIITLKKIIKCIEERTKHKDKSMVIKRVKSKGPQLSARTHRITWSCNRSSKLRLENESSTGTIMVESSWSICWSALTTVLLFWSPIISGNEPIISFFKWWGQIVRICNSFSAKASELTRKSSHRNWFSISLATSSSSCNEDEPRALTRGSTLKYSGSFSNNISRRSCWIDLTNNNTRTRVSLLIEPKPSRWQGSKTLYYQKLTYVIFI